MESLVSLREDKSLFLVLMLSNAIGLAFGGQPYFWKCPTGFPVQKKFNATKYAGRWYEIEKFFEWEEFSDSCTVSDFVANKDGNMTMKIHSFNKSTGKRKVVEGNLEATNATKNEGRFRVVYTSKHRRYKPRAPEVYWILGTDYGNYSIVWSCENIGIASIQDVRFLSRTKFPEYLIRLKVYNKLRSLKIFTRFLTKTNQVACPRLGQFHKPHKEDEDWSNTAKNSTTTTTPKPNRDPENNTVTTNHTVIITAIAEPSPVNELLSLNDTIIITATIDESQNNVSSTIEEVINTEVMVENKK